MRLTDNLKQFEEMRLRMMRRAAGRIQRWWKRWLAKKLAQKKSKKKKESSK